jgi:hypothetical protein
MDKFKAGDKVVEKGKTSQILRIIGRTVKGGLPYSLTYKWACEWTEITGTYRKELKEDDIELYTESCN